MDINFISPESLDFFLRLMVALILGLLIGVERVYAQKTAGMRTYALVSLGAALFVVISQIVIGSSELVNLDPMRTASQVVVGLGFIGAGIIIFRDDKLMGITSAAGIWVAGGIGIAAGYGLYDIAIYATILTLFTFTILWFVESRLKKVFNRHSSQSD